MEDSLRALDFRYDKEEEAIEAISFLEYSECREGKMQLDEESGLYCILVSESKLHVANKLIEIYESEKNKTLMNQDKGRLAEESKSTRPYVDSKERFTDMRSTSFSFLVVGLIGLIILVLGITDIFPTILVAKGFSFTNIVLLIVFLAAIIFGLYSLNSTKNIKKNISQEEKFIKDVMEWFISSYTASIINEQIILDTTGENADNEVYFERINFIRSVIEKKFSDIDEALLGKLSEDLYQDLYE